MDGPFSFLNNIKNVLESYFAPAQTQVSSALNQFFPSKSNSLRMDSSGKAPDLKIPKPAPTSTPQRTVPTPQDFQSGFSKFGNGNPPMATMSADLSKAATQLPPTIDPYLAAVISLMETGGGVKQAANNNAYNITGTQPGNTSPFINYPSPSVALLGGDNNGVQSKGFVGNLLQNPSYEPFRQSGNLADFFKVYTPPGQAYGNPSMEDLLARYQAIRALFPNL